MNYADSYEYAYHSNAGWEIFVQYLMSYQLRNPGKKNGKPNHTFGNANNIQREVAVNKNGETTKYIDLEFERNHGNNDKFSVEFKVETKLNLLKFDNIKKDVEKLQRLRPKEDHQNNYVVIILRTRNQFDIIWNGLLSNESKPIVNSSVSELTSSKSMVKLINLATA